MSNVSIIIRAYNEARHLPRLFDGLAKQDHTDFEVILVDSGSTDNSVEIARTHGARIVPIAKADFSFGRALNYGCRAAKGDILLFASAHVYPERSDWVSQMVAPFENPKIGSVYGRQRGGETNKFSEHRLFLSWFPNESQAWQQSYFCNNANCAVRRVLWEDQPYDEALTGLEDLDWAKKIQKKGYGIAYQAPASIIHVHEETWPQVRNRYRREAIALAQIDPNTAKSFGYFLRVGLWNACLDIAAALRAGAIGKVGEAALFRFNQNFGAWQGMRSGQAVSEALLTTFYYPPKSGAEKRDALDAPEKTIDYQEKPKESST